MPTLFLDLETASTVPIKAGSYRYSEGARILIQAYAIDAGPVVAEPFDAGMLQPLIDAADIVVAHNGGLFDRVQLARHGVTIPVEKLHDTMAIAYQHSLPGSLDALAGVFRLDATKDKDGKRLIRLFCVPKKTGGFATPETHPAEWEKFLAYAKADIEAMRQLYKKIPMWNLTPFERRVWATDQSINDRGVAVDVELARAAITAVDAAQVQLAERASDLTLGLVGSATQRDALLKFINGAFGLGLDDLKGSTVEKALEREDLPSDLRELLVVRSQASTTSTAKYRALLNCVCADGRLRGLKQYCGASRTGRWAGRQWQPDNLPRSAIAGFKGDALQEAIEIGIAALKGGYADLMFDSVMELTSAALRGLMVPREGRTLAVADLNAIEGRVLAWLAGEQWKLDAYARGEDLYKATAGKILGKKPEDINDDERQQVGKVSELACFGPDTLVLTNEGYTPICKIATRHQLWDGRSWVTHQGLLYKGERETIKLAGVRVTAEHLIATQKTWRPASELASSESTLSLALETGSGNLPSWELSARQKVCRTTRSSVFSARAGRRLTRSTITISARAKARAVIRALKRRLGIGERTTGVTPVLCPTTRTAGAYATAYLRASIDATILTTLATPTTAGAASRCTNPGAPTAGLSSLISPLLMVGITRLLISTASMLTEATNPKTSASSPAGRTRTTSERSETCSNALRSSRQKSPVFDIYQSGPNNCFTVLSDRGPLLVHNCGFQGGVGAFVTFATAYNLDLGVIADRARETLPRATVEESANGWDWAIEREMETHGLSRETWIGIDAIKRAWRAAHPKIARFWRDLEDAARAAIENPGDEYKAGRVTFIRDGAWLRMILPSGRSLCYPAPTIGEEAITFMGANPFTRRFERMQTYGGKLCLAGDALVLTDSGWRRLDHISALDRVWDGEAWVAHGGLAVKGARRTVVLDGVRMTPDHEVLTKEGWKRASSCEGLDRAPVALPDCVAVSRFGWVEISVADPLRLRNREEHAGDRILQGEGPVVWLPETRPHGGETADARHVSPPSIRSLEINAGAMPEPYASRMEKLRRAWHHRLSRLGAFIRSFLGGHGPFLSDRAVVGTHRQQLRVFGGGLSLGDPQGAVAEHAQVSSDRYAVGVCDCGGGRGAEWDRYNDAAVSSRSDIVPVFDLLDTGRHNQFVIAGATGPLIVHNCENATQAVARDILAHGLVLAEERGFEPVMHVHDEIIAENCTAAGLSEVMSIVPSWADGLPLAAKGFDCARYRK